MSDDPARWMPRAETDAEMARREAARARWREIVDRRWGIGGTHMILADARKSVDEMREEYRAIRFEARACGMSKAAFDAAVAERVGADFAASPGRWLAAARAVVRDTMEKSNG